MFVGELNNESAAQTLMNEAELKRTDHLKHRDIWLGLRGSVYSPDTYVSSGITLRQMVCFSNIFRF